jgi:hypothetical protein
MAESLQDAGYEPRGLLSVFDGGLIDLRSTPKHASYN